MKQFTVVTLFPELFPGPLGIGVTGRGIEQGLFGVQTVSIREHGMGRHKIVDDTPYGGGSGMVMKPEPLVAAIEEARQKSPPNTPVYLMSPQGPRFQQAQAHQLLQAPGLILVCGRYEGLDERIMPHLDGEISVGDFILSGGEIAAMIVLDTIARLIPGVLGNPESLNEESFGAPDPTDSSSPDPSSLLPLLEYPQYTRPRTYQEQEVPEVLLSGNHEVIRKWRLEQSLRRTLQRRPDLLEGRPLSKEERKILTAIQQEDKNTP